MGQTVATQDPAGTVLGFVTDMREGAAEPLAAGDAKAEYFRADRCRRLHSLAHRRRGLRARALSVRRCPLT